MKNRYLVSRQRRTVNVLVPIYRCDVGRCDVTFPQQISQGNRISVRQARVVIQLRNKQAVNKLDVGFHTLPFRGKYLDLLTTGLEVVQLTRH
jgi:hypothetical protein